MNFDGLGKVGRAATGLFGVALFAGMAACSGFGPGDYLVYRVAAPDPKLSGDCNNDPDHKTTFQNGSTIVMYAVAGDGEDTYYLDVGNTVLLGAVTDEGYAFTGNTTDVQDTGQATITSKTTLSVTVVDEGDQISGTFTQVQETSCSGTGCDFFDPGKCTSTTSFVGVLIDEPAVGISGGGLGP